MAFLSVNGVPCGAPSTITLPLTGRPHADISLAVQEVSFSAGDQVSVQIEDGLTYTMTVERLGARGGFLRAKLIGGTGGLRRDVEPKFYSNAAPDLILRELLEECGEQVGELGFPEGSLPQWVRPGGPAADALHALMVRYPQHVWRMRPDGKIDVSVPQWQPHQGPPFKVEAADPATGIWLVGFDAKLLPGKHVQLQYGPSKTGKRAARVTHEIQEDWSGGKKIARLRTIIGTGEDAMDGAEAVARRALRWVDYLALFPCTVLRDHGDHTLDLSPEHTGLPQMTKVRLLQPLPGCRVKIKAGSQVLLQFQQGDPARPIVSNFASATLEKLELVTGKGQKIVLDDDRGEVSPEDQLYQRPSVLVQDQAGQKVEMMPNTGTITVSANTTVNINAPSVSLAGGGPPVARVGDQVDPVTHKIVSGSTRVRSG